MKKGNSQPWWFEDVIFIIIVLNFGAVTLDFRAVQLIGYSNQGYYIFPQK